MRYVPRVMDDVSPRAISDLHPPRTVERWIKRECGDRPEHLRLATDGEGWYVSHDVCFDNEGDAREYADQFMANWPRHPDQSHIRA